MNKKYIESNKNTNDHFLKNHTKIICVFLFILLILSYVGVKSKASADSISLSINPPITQIKAIAPSDTRAPFTLKNQSSETVNFKIIYKLFKADNIDGQISFLTENDPIPDSAKTILQKIAVIQNGKSLHSFVLGPKESKSLQLLVSVPQNQPSADYYFSVIFLATPQTSAQEPDTSQDQNTVSNVQEGIAMNVLLSIGQQASPQAVIENFSAPSYVESGPVPFTVQVLNPGLHFISPHGVILIQNMFGQTVGRIIIPKTNVLAGTTRDLTDINQVLNSLNSETNMQYSSPQTIWPEPFLLGFYKATLSIAVTDKGPIYTKSTQFIAFPAILLIDLLFGLVILFLIYLRVIKYMNK